MSAKSTVLLAFLAVASAGASRALELGLESVPPMPLATGASQTASPSLSSLKKEVRHLQRDLQSAVDSGAVTQTPNGAAAMEQALTLAHWCDARGTQVLKQLEKLSGGRRVYDIDDPSETGRLQAEARAVVDGAQRLIQKLRREPQHLAEEGQMLPSGDDVLTRYGAMK